MSRPRVPRLLTVGLVASGLMAADAAAAATGEPRLTEKRIVRIALTEAAAFGDRHPRLIQHAAGSREQANRIASGDIVPDGTWCYLIAERGSFRGIYTGSVPPRGKVRRAPVLTFVVNAKTGAVLDYGVQNHYPDLAKLGSVRTDLRRSVA